MLANDEKGNGDGSLLQPHQQQMVAAVENLHQKLSFGSAIVSKQGSVGLTLSLVHLTATWLQSGVEEEEDELEVEMTASYEMTSEPASTAFAKAPKRHPSRAVLLVVPRSRLFKYLSYFATHQPEITVLPYAVGADTTDTVTEQWSSLLSNSLRAVVLVCAENMPHFLENGQYLTSLVRSFLVGVLLDIRCPAAPIGEISFNC
jgi:hypothetical protein